MMQVPKKQFKPGGAEGGSSGTSGGWTTSSTNGPGSTEQPPEQGGFALSRNRKVQPIESPVGSELSATKAAPKAYAQSPTRPSMRVPDPGEVSGLGMRPAMPLMGMESEARFGEPLRNDSSVARTATHDHELDANQEDFVTPKLPAESQGLGSTGEREQLSSLTGIEKQIAANIAKLGEPGMQGPTGRVPASTGRKILGTAAGIGLGALTMNPFVGMGVRQSILDQPTMRAQEEAAMRRAPLEAENTRLTGLAGITQQGLGRQAELGQAAAAQAQATNAANEVENFETGGTTPGSKQRVVMPKRGGLNAPTRKVGPEQTPAPHEIAQRYEVKQTDTGYVTVDKTTGESKPVVGPDGKPIEASPKNNTLANDYIDALNSGDQKRVNEILTAMRASAAQVGANIAAENTKKNEQTARAETIAAKIAEKSKNYEDAVKALGEYITSDAGEMDAQHATAARRALEQIYKKQGSSMIISNKSGTVTITK